MGAEAARQARAAVPTDAAELLAQKLLALARQEAATNTAFRQQA
jgi:hypothetical protein